VSFFLTMHEDQDYLMQGLQAGAAGYLLKDTKTRLQSSLACCETLTSGVASLSSRKCWSG